MENVTSSAACFTHVVFPDTPGGSRRVIDFTAPGGSRLVAVRELARRRSVHGVPPAVDSATPRHPADETLSYEERSFLDWIFSGAGLDFSLYRPESLRRRLPACLRALRVPSVRKARRALQHDPSLRPTALSALLIGVTSFFRDPPVFSVLASRVLPALAGRPGVVRAWSAGCSDGLELYSLAIVLAEFGLVGRSRLLGTDCRAEAVDHARAGLFTADAVAAVHGDWLDRYFVPSDDGTYCVRDDVRKATEWRCDNLLGDPRRDLPHSGEGEGGFDLILCRNVAIYLTPAAAARLWRRLYAALRPGGVLVTGKAERVSHGGLQPLAPCVFRKDGWVV
jgi:chemotaxis methyl-accepting protein methylase